MQTVDSDLDDDVLIPTLMRMFSSVDGGCNVSTTATTGLKFMPGYACISQLEGRFLALDRFESAMMTVLVPVFTVRNHEFL